PVRLRARLGPAPTLPRGRSEDGATTTLPRRVQDPRGPEDAGQAPGRHGRDGSAPRTCARTPCHGGRGERAVAPVLPTARRPAQAPAAGRPAPALPHRRRAPLERRGSVPPRRAREPRAGSCASPHRPALTARFGASVTPCSTPSACAGRRA